MVHMAEGGTNERATFFASNKKQEYCHAVYFEVLLLVYVKR
jgi:hypothetical protein